MYIEKELVEKIEQLHSYYGYHNPRSSKQTTEFFIDDLSKLLEQLKQLVSE